MGQHTDEVLGRIAGGGPGSPRSSAEVQHKPCAIESEPAAGPLSGLRVLDFSQAVAGPVLTQLLAAFGAEVIKVESEAHQQRGRTREGMDPRIVLQQRVTFADMNRNKRSITVDMGTREGRELVRRLIPHCDVVVENFSPRVTGPVGIGLQGASETSRRHNNDKTARVWAFRPLPGLRWVGRRRHGGDRYVPPLVPGPMRRSRPGLPSGRRTT